MKLRRESDWGPIGTNPTDPPTSKKYFSVPPEKGEEFSSALVLINQSEGSVRSVSKGTPARVVL